MNAFTYHNLTFIPVSELTGENRKYDYVSRHIYTDETMKEKIFPYNFDEFYAASNGSIADIFQCVENGLYYLPSEFQLYGWKL